MQSLIALIVAFTIGGVGGWTINHQTAPREDMRTEETHNNPNTESVTDQAAMPAAEDFVSLRPSIVTLPAESLSEVELAGLLYMREEEKLARDVYTTLYDTWGLAIFSNIAQSEQTHTEAVRDLLEKYEVADPVTDDTVGIFQNTDLQQLYSYLTTRGSISIEEALAVGALIEDLDIYDLQQEIGKTDNQDIVLVYENLTRGSRNHLRSFTAQLTERGVSYTPEYISQAEYDAIISTEQERGNRESTSNNPGRGTGRGWGNR